MYVCPWSLSEARVSCMYVLGLSLRHVFHVCMSLVSL